MAAVVVVVVFVDVVDHLAVAYDLVAVDSDDFVVAVVAYVNILGNKPLQEQYD